MDECDVSILHALHSVQSSVIFTNSYVTNRETILTRIVGGKKSVERLKVMVKERKCLNIFQNTGMIRGNQNNCKILEGF